LLSSHEIEHLLDQSTAPNDAITKLVRAYRKEGYFLVAVSAHVNGKSIHIMVIQGQITHKKIRSGLQWFYNGIGGVNLTQADIIRRNILAGAYAQRDGDQLITGFGPASNPEGSQFVVSEHPLPHYSFASGSFTFGNYGSRYTSNYITGVNAIINAGYGIQITGGYSRGLPSLNKSSKGSVYYAGNIGISWVNPWGIYGFSQQWTHYQLGQVTAPYYFTGNSVLRSFTGSQLLYANAHNQLSVNEGLAWTKYVETALNGLIPISNQPYSYYTLGVTYNHSFQWFGQGGDLSAAATYNQGVSGYHGMFVKAKGAPSPRFHFLTANFSYTQVLPWGFTAQWTANGQWADSTMPANNQWIIGGFGNLSAYYSGVAEGDSGYAGRFNLQTPAAHWGPVTGTGSFFVETAGVTDHYLLPYQHPWENLSDIGLGLSLATPWGSQISAVSALPIGHNGFAPNQISALRKQRIDAYFVFTQNF
jgi:hemolysin activation/secretion protein